MIFRNIYIFKENIFIKTISKKNIIKHILNFY